MLSQHHNLLLLLALLDQVVVTTLSLSACVLGFHILLQLFLVHNVLIGDHSTGIVRLVVSLFLCLTFHISAVLTRGVSTLRSLVLR